MEIKSTIQKMKTLVRFCLSTFLFMAAGYMPLAAQPPMKAYTVRNGRMYIELSKHIKDASLDSFIAQYELHDLALKRFIKNDFPDSLKMLGWQIEANNKQTVIISKPLFALDNIDNPVNKIIYTEKHPTFGERFPAVNNGISYGYNRFKNKHPFTVKDSVVTFFLRNNTQARKTYLAGSFNDWVPNNLPMTKTDSGWIAYVKLGPGKYWYKFIVDGNWIVDRDNRLSENDGLGNTNSIFYRPNVDFKLNAFPNARNVYIAGSFNSWRPDELQMIKTETGWELPLYLPEGTHTYKFVVDGAWYADDKNKDRLPDGERGYNSVLRIGKSHLFKLNGYTEAKKVILSGSFNGWRQDELLMNKTGTGWELPYTLGPGNYEYKFQVDGKWISDPQNPLTVRNKTNFGNSYLIIDPNYTFRLKGFSKAKAVYLAGDFNDWDPNLLPMKREGDDWIFSVHLSVGKHLYKFIVDGKWIIDPTNKLWEQNEYRTGNSIIWIEK
jgi:hypothetical protein